MHGAISYVCADAVSRRGLMAFRAEPISCSAWSRLCSDCRFIQNGADVPKKRARRRAVSAVMSRVPLMIWVMRLVGTSSQLGGADVHLSEIFGEMFAGMYRGTHGSTTFR